MLDRLTIERAEAAAEAGPFVLALSGGGDSTALLHLLAERYGPSRLRAVVIDHALRPGSAQDARRAAGFATAIGAAAEVRALSWAAGASRSQQAARIGRYRALCDAARAAGARVIFTAHNADDQAETVSMRSHNASNWRGLAGIAPFAAAPVWPEGRGLHVARPLLGVRRGPLRDWLRARDADWIEDPANSNPAYERVRTRWTLARLESEGHDPMPLAYLAEHMRAVVDRMNWETAGLIDYAARFEADAITVNRGRWTKALETSRLRALSLFIAAAAGAEREPAAAAVVRLDARLHSDVFRGASLGGAHITRAGDAFRITRDRGALFGRADGAGGVAPLDLPQNVETVWDGRLALTAYEGGWRVEPAENGAVLVKNGEHAELAWGHGPVHADWLLRERTMHALARAH